MRTKSTCTARVARARPGGALRARRRQRRRVEPARGAPENELEARREPVHAQAENGARRPAPREKRARRSVALGDARRAEGVPRGEAVRAEGAKAVDDVNVLGLASAVRVQTLGEAL